MPSESDERLIEKGACQRSNALEKLYAELAATAPCNCEPEHSPDRQSCPKAVWEQAARIALLSSAD